jgi:hypothetical protein
MEQYSKSSFIPKKSIKRVDHIRGRRRVYILEYVAYALFFATIIATASTFTYLKILEKGLEEKISTLNAQRSSFNNADLESIKLWEYRLALAQHFFEAHASPYQVLTALESGTAADISFRSFSYTDNGDNGNQVAISLTGEADQFDEVVFQTNAFTESSLLATANVTGVTKTLVELNTDTVEVAPTDEESTDDQKPIQFNVDLLLSRFDILFDVDIYSQATGVTQNPSVTESVVDTDVDVESVTADQSETDSLVEDVPVVTEVSAQEMFAEEAIEDVGPDGQEITETN